MSYPRNSACPCGSGKKYKRCCIDNDNVDVSGTDIDGNGITEGVTGGVTGGVTNNMKLPIILGVAAALITAITAWAVGPNEAFAAAAALTMGLFTYMALRNPPTSKGGTTGGAQINFGGSSSKRVSNRGRRATPPSRSQRRKR